MLSPTQFASASHRQSVLMYYSEHPGDFCIMIFFRSFRAVVLCALPVLLFNCQVSASTGRSHEITNIHFENVTQTTVDVVWDTVHPSTSQVLIARDLNYEPERWAPTTADAALVTTHRVTVD